jgi:hypothetical protein
MNIWMFKFEFKGIEQKLYEHRNKKKQQQKQTIKNAWEKWQEDSELV